MSSRIKLEKIEVEDWERDKIMLAQLKASLKGGGDKELKEVCKAALKAKPAINYKHLWDEGSDAELISAIRNHRHNEMRGILGVTSKDPLRPHKIENDFALDTRRKELGNILATLEPSLKTRVKDTGPRPVDARRFIRFAPSRQRSSLSPPKPKPINQNPNAHLIGKSMTDEQRKLKRDANQRAYWGMTDAEALLKAKAVYKVHQF